MINKALKKKEISKLINISFRKCGLRETVIFADKLMQSGFTLATRAGLSIAMDDMLVPAVKHDLIPVRLSIVPVVLDILFVVRGAESTAGESPEDLLLKNRVVQILVVVWLLLITWGTYQ